MVEAVSRNADDDDPGRPDEDPSGSGGRHGAHRRGRKSKKRSFWKELPILIVIAVALTIVIQLFIAKVFMIPSGSMETTLMVGDRILVDRITYDFKDPSPGDVVVFKGPPAWTAHEIPPQESGNVVVKALRGLGSLVGFAPADEQDFVKRVIAVGGQTVSCCDPQNRVIVDGKALNETYIHWMDPANKLQISFPPVKVPQGDLWVMGDNRNNSADSRYQGGGGLNGVVPVGNVIGKVRLIVLPPSQWGTVPGDDAQTNAQPVALGAPAWEGGLPAGVGIAAAVPTLWASRKVRAGLRKAAGRRR